MDNEELVKKVTEYFTRRDIRKYNPQEEGVWRIVGGKREQQADYLNPGRHQIPETYSGRFIDIVTVAVQKGTFYGDRCTDVDNINNGYIVKSGVTTVPVKKDMDRLIRKL